LTFPVPVAPVQTTGAQVPVAPAATGAAAVPHVVGSPVRVGQPDASASPLSPRSLNEAALARVFRAIVCVGPMVVKKKVCTPALAVPFFASPMSFLAGPAPGGTRECIHEAVRDVFTSSMGGWLWLCRVLGVCDSGLYLVGRISTEHQFMGQPSTVMCAGINKGINPGGGYQWGSRRFTMRPYLDMWDVDIEAPGSPNAHELSQLRDVLSGPEGATLAVATGCTIETGPAGLSGPRTAVSRIAFDWSAPWVQGCEAATLVEDVA